jgi:hypothetical protein
VECVPTIVNPADDLGEVVKSVDDRRAIDRSLDDCAGHWCADTAGALDAGLLRAQTAARCRAPNPRRSAGCCLRYS